MTSPLLGVGVIVVVGIVAVMLRRNREASDEQIRMRPAEEPDEAPLGMPDAEPAEAELEGDEADEEEDAIDAVKVALSSDGHAFAPHRHGVVIAPQRHFRTSRQAGDDGSRMIPAAHDEDIQPPIHLAKGDLIAARVVKGSPDLAPWRLETLGRDRDLVVWPFETEDAAHAACELLAARVVRAPADRDGDPVEITDEDFEQAQAELEAALHALENPTADDEIQHPPGTGPAR
jgi:hypothetical protein